MADKDFKKFISHIKKISSKESFKKFRIDIGIASVNESKRFVASGGVRPKSKAAIKRGGKTLLKTGRGFKSIQYRYDDKGIYIGTNVEYMKKHREGFEGTESVEAHIRKGFKRKKPTYKSKNIILNVARKIKSVFSKNNYTKYSFVKAHTVRAHQRRVKYTVREFLKPLTFKEFESISAYYVGANKNA